MSRNYTDDRYTVKRYIEGGRSRPPPATLLEVTVPSCAIYHHGPAPPARMTTALALLLTSAVLSATVPASASASVVNADYEALLRRYARGEREAAIAEMGEWREADLERQVRVLERAARDGPGCPACKDPLDDLPLKAAVMLHFDRGELERPRNTGVEAPRPCPGAQAARARRIAAILARRHATGDFARRFFLAAAQVCQWDFCLQAASESAREGLELFPKDGELLLTLGSTLEEGASISRRPSTERTSELREAERVLEDAVAADPAALEPRVRLGRVRWRLGKDDAAAQTLEAARALEGPPSMAYLARLYLGLVYQRRGRIEDADAEFRRALAIVPDAQAAAVALSYAQGSRGDASGARAALRHALDRVSRLQLDPFWLYPASNAASVDAILRALRDETTE
jgi:tetratricopeptide (TPR) repeat protein